VVSRWSKSRILSAIEQGDPHAAEQLEATDSLGILGGDSALLSLTVS
jgi:hypothetical protein